MTVVPGRPVPFGHLTWHRATVQGAAASYGMGGEGLPVLFLHGWALGDHTYKRALKRLAQQGCRVVAPALPGFGRSASLPASRADLEGYADWLAEFLDAVDLPGPLLVIGHSFGGGVAVQLAHDHPDRVRQLVLVNSIGGMWNSRQMAERPLWDWGINFPADLWPPTQLARLLPAYFEDVVCNVAFNPMALWRAGMLARRTDLTDELAELRARRLPVVALSGDRDRVIPRTSFQTLCDALGCDGQTVPGRHSWLVVDPDAFGRALADTVRGLQEESGGRAAGPAPMDRAAS